MEEQHVPWEIHSKARLDWFAAQNEICGLEMRPFWCIDGKLLCHTHPSQQTVIGITGVSSLTGALGRPSSTGATPVDNKAPKATSYQTHPVW